MLAGVEGLKGHLSWQIEAQTGQGQLFSICSHSLKLGSVLMPVIGLSPTDGRVQAGSCESWFKFLKIFLTSGTGLEGCKTGGRMVPRGFEWQPRKEALLGTGNTNVTKIFRGLGIRSLSWP